MDTGRSPLPSLDFYRIEYESTPPLLRAADQRPLNAQEITESCELLLATARRQRCPYWMLDGRHHQQQQPQELHDWMRDEYFPRVRAELGQAPYVAFLVPPFVLAGLPAKGYPDPEDWNSHAAHLAWFAEEDQAREWLDRHRARHVTAGRSEELRPAVAVPAR